MRRDSEQVLTEWLVLHAQSGSAEALEQLLRIWYPKLLRYAAAQLRDDEAAKDVVQEALLGIAKRIRRLRDPAAFPRWAYEILQRRGIDHVRRLARSRETARPEPDPYSGAADPETIGDMEGRVSLETALTSLGADSYQAVHLRYVIGLSLKEIASILGIPEGTVKSRLHTARAQLRNLLAE